MKKSHGMRSHPLYGRWTAILARCTNPKVKSYYVYGGRGISICEEWRHDFQAFYDHVSQLSHYGEKGYTLDRIDNNRNYEPGNMRFVTRTGQNRNKRNNLLITYNGKTQCLSAWAGELNINRVTLSDRIRKGWSIEQALTMPVKAKS